MESGEVIVSQVASSARSGDTEGRLLIAHTLGVGNDQFGPSPINSTVLIVVVIIELISAYTITEEVHNKSFH